MAENSAPTPEGPPLLSGPTWAIRMLARAIEIVADRTLDGDDAHVVRELCDEALVAMDDWVPTDAWSRVLEQVGSTGPPE